MGFFDVDEIKKRAASRDLLTLAETGMVVKPVSGAFDNIEDNGKGLEIEAEVLLSYIDSIKKGDTIKVAITGGDPVLPATKVQSNLNEGFKPGKVTTDILVLEKVVKTADGEVSARWANKGAGQARKLSTGMCGPETISFRYYDEEDNRRQRIAIPTGENYEPYMKKLATQLNRWKEAVEAGDKDKAKKEYITVHQNMISPERAAVVNNMDDMVTKLHDLGNDGATMAFVRIVNSDTNKTLVVNVSMTDKGELLSTDQIAERVKDSLTRSIRRNEDVEEVLAGNQTVEVIPGSRFYMANNADDLSRNSTVKYVESYLKRSDKALDFQKSVQPSGVYMPKVLIFSAFDVEGEKESVAGGYVRSVLGTTNNSSNVLNLVTKNINGEELTGFPVWKSKDKADGHNAESDEEHDAPDNTASSGAEKQSAPAATSDDVGSDFDQIPDFDNDKQASHHAPGM